MHKAWSESYIQIHQRHLDEHGVIQIDLLHELFGLARSTLLAEWHMSLNQIEQTAHLWPQDLPLDKPVSIKVGAPCTLTVLTTVAGAAPIMIFDHTVYALGRDVGTFKTSLVFRDGSNRRPAYFPRWMQKQLENATARVV